jgi:hypothetical protein
MIQATCGLIGRIIHGYSVTHCGCAISINSNARVLLGIAGVPSVYLSTRNYQKHQTYAHHPQMRVKPRKLCFTESTEMMGRAVNIKSKLEFTE